MSNMNEFLVRGSDGTVDVDATTLKFRGALEVYIAERETENALIAAAVSEVFDQFKGANINMPALTSYALQRLNATPSNFMALSERIQEYVRENAGEGGIYKIAKGKGGGVRRVADLPPAATESK